MRRLIRARFNINIVYLASLRLPQYLLYVVLVRIVFGCWQIGKIWRQTKGDHYYRDQKDPAMKELHVSHNYASKIQ